MKAVHVKALPGHHINITFDDGVAGNVDLNELVSKGIFQILKDEHSFSKVYISGNAIAWSEELEIDAGNIYAEIVDKLPSQILHKPIYNAAD